MKFSRGVWGLAGIAITVALPFLHFDVALPLSGEAQSTVLKWAWTAVLAAIVFGIERRPRKFLYLRGFGWGDALVMVATMLVALFRQY